MARCNPNHPGQLYSFSPLHEGDTSVAFGAGHDRGTTYVSVPFTRGTPLWPRPTAEAVGYSLFQSPSRGGHLCGPAPGDGSAPRATFQSPSRGGHLCGAGAGIAGDCLVRCFSPLHEGDTSVAQLSAYLGDYKLPGFSPLHEGDTSVATGKATA